MLIITQIREYKKDRTLSKIYLNGNFFCHALEDVARPPGVKIKGETCVPEGVYNFTINYSNRFKRDMVLLYNKDDFSLERQGVRFTGIRVHGGNDIQDTYGCVLAAHNTDGHKVWGSAERDLVGSINNICLHPDSVSCRWVITSE